MSRDRYDRARDADGAAQARHARVSCAESQSTPMQRTQDMSRVEPPPNSAVANQPRVTVRTGRDHYRTDIIAGGHTLIADEPKGDGGGDAGPTPYDLVAAALGACTAMTLRMYADRKQWPLDEVIVRVTHSKDHAADEARCEQGADARLDVLRRVIVLGGPLGDTQRARLLEIADKCPVHRTLSAGLRVETQLALSGEPT
jgi:uncharacterized OsmC-like protein